MIDQRDNICVYVILVSMEYRAEWLGTLAHATFRCFWRVSGQVKYVILSPFIPEHQKHRKYLVKSHRKKGQKKMQLIAIKTFKNVVLLQVVVDTSLESPAGLAIDWVTSKIYWTDAGMSNNC